MNPLLVFKCAISEYVKASRLETQKAIQESLDAASESKTLSNEKQRLISAIFTELGIDEHKGESCAIISAIQSLKQDVNVYKGQMERLELQATSKQNDLLLEIESKRTEDINKGIAAAKVSNLRFFQFSLQKAKTEFNSTLLIR